MKKSLLLILVAFCFCGVSRADDTTTRDEALVKARYYKSIFRFDDAIDVLAASLTGELDLEIMGEIADCHYQNGNVADAMNAYSLLVQMSPENLPFKVRLMSLLYKVKDYPGTVRMGRSILSMDGIPAIYALTGDAYNQMNVSDSAYFYYLDAIRVRPHYESVVSKMCDIQIKRRNYAEVIRVTDDFLALDPDNMVVNPIRGLALYFQKKYAESLEVFERQLELGDSSYVTHLYVGRNKEELDRTQEAEAEYLTAWQIDSSDVNHAVAIANVKEKLGKDMDSEVMPWFDKALSMMAPDPATMGMIWQNRGAALYSRKDWDGAIGCYKEAYRYNDGFISAFPTIAWCYEQKKDYESALEWYGRYLKAGKPGSKTYGFVEESVTRIREELFMEGKL